MRRANLARLAVLLALAGGMALALVYRAELAAWVQQSREWIREQGPWGPAALAAAYVPAAVLVLPGSWLTLVGGYAFGLWAVIPVSLGSTAGAAAAFLVSRYLARGWVEQRLAGSPRFQALDRAVGSQGFQIVFLTRLSPVLPYNFLNYAYGLTRVRFRDYVLASWIGMLPGTFLYVYLGTAGGAAVSGEKTLGEWIFFGLGLAVTVAVTVLVTRLARQALAEAAPAIGQPAKAAASGSETGATA